ncbi:MAG: SPASM domain-containing protein [Phycisphaeraceae bacterium]|nr:SPASM domain-containing protein [Phycisphaeraceae bacterium]
MSMIALNLDVRLARAAALTGKLKSRCAGGAMAHLAFLVDFLARGLAYVWRNRGYLSTWKLINMALVNIQFRLKTERVLGRPYKMKIESTNICNTHCQLCPTGIGMEGRPKGKMTFDQYRKLIDQLRRHLLALDLSMWGDPLIVPEIFDMIRYAHDRGVWTYISSNLHAFKPHKNQAESLVRSGLDMLTCSLHGASQETYELYQPGKSFQDSVDKIRHILDVRRKLNSATPAIQLNFVVTRHNEHEREAFQKLADELGCKAVFSTASLNIRFLNQTKQLQPLGLAPDVLAQKTQQHIENWLPKDASFALKPYREMLKNPARSEDYNGHKPMDCSWPWLASVINWDGQVVTCCGSFDPAEDFGNVFDVPFGKIWNSDKYRMARRSFKHRLDDKQAKDNPCATCPGYML